MAGVNGAANDSIAVTVGGSQPYTASGNNYFADLGSQWQEAEFNVFGDGGGDQAVFNSGSTVNVHTAVESGTTSAHSCDLQSFTGETNNLNLVSPCCSVAGVNGETPAILLTESNAASAKSVCACPSGATWNVYYGSCACNDTSKSLINGQCVNECPPGEGWVINAAGFSCRPIPPCPAACPRCIVDNIEPGPPKFICLPARSAQP
ncbi:MAG: hypothetical protein WBF43_12405 [Methylocella sp.]